MSGESKYKVDGKYKTTKLSDAKILRVGEGGILVGEWCSAMTGAWNVGVWNKHGKTLLPSVHADLLPPTRPKVKYWVYRYKRSNAEQWSVTVTNCKENAMSSKGTTREIVQELEVEV
jgi:hypothetical protein